MKKQYTNETFTFYSDPGHAWLKVSFMDIHRIGLGISTDFSGYSYYKWDKEDSTGFAYLEEDCDAGIFLAAYYGKFKAMPRIVRNDSYEDSFIRGLQRFPRGKAFEANMKAAYETVKQVNAA